MLPVYGTPLNLHMIPLVLEVRYVMHFELIDSSSICIQNRISPLSAIVLCATCTTTICRPPITICGRLLIADAQHLTFLSKVQNMECDSGNTVPRLRRLLSIHAPTNQTKSKRQNFGYNRIIHSQTRQPHNHRPNSLAPHGALKVPITIARNEELVPEFSGLVCLFDERLHGYAVLGNDCRSSRSTPATRKIQFRAGWLAEVHATPARFLVQHGGIFCG